MGGIAAKWDEQHRKNREQRGSSVGITIIMTSSRPWIVLGSALGVNPIVRDVTAQLTEQYRISRDR